MPPPISAQNQSKICRFGADGKQANNKPVPNNAENKRNPAGDPLVYIPHWISGGAKHPDLIVETPGLANVVPPPISYRPHLPNHLSEKGLVSGFQFERICYAGQARRRRSQIVSDEQMNCLKNEQRQNHQLQYQLS